MNRWIAQLLKTWRWVDVGVAISCLNLISTFCIEAITENVAERDVGVEIYRKQIFSPSEYENLKQLIIECDGVCEICF